MSTKTGIMLALVAIGVTLAYQLSSRLSDQAVDVAVGVLCGIAASIPVSLGLLLALLRRRAHTEEDEPDPRSPPEVYPSYAPPRQPYPPVIIVTPPNQLPHPYGGYLPPGNLLEPPAPRDFKIIGDQDDLDT